MWNFVIVVVGVLGNLIQTGAAEHGSSCNSASECEAGSSSLLQSKRVMPTHTGVFMEEETDTEDGPVPVEGVHCTFQRLSIEYDAEVDNESAAEEYSCVEADGTTHLLEPAFVEAHLFDVSVGDELVLDLPGTSLVGVDSGTVRVRHKRNSVAMGMRGLPGYECKDNSDTGFQPPYHECGSKIERYCGSYEALRANCPLTCDACPTNSFGFSGVRAVRMLALIAELEDVQVGYLGSDREAREAHALAEFEQVADTLAKSTYGKVTVDVDASRAVTIPLALTGVKKSGSQLAFSDDECSGKGAQTDLGERMRAALPADVDLNNFDSLVLYYPEEIAGQFGWCGVGGWAYGGVVAVDPSSGGRFTVNRESSSWLKGVSMRKFFKKGTGTVLAHEFGHQLGFGHAAGTADAKPSNEAAWKQGLANYGDNSAVMGNDHSVQNSFTAVVRWRLGALPESSINMAPTYGEAFDIKALTLTPDSSAVSAAVLQCPNCKSKILTSDGKPKHDWKGGYIWLSFRGDEDDCNAAGCHTDHPEHHNKVFVHYQQPEGGLSYMTTERWYYLEAGESYSPPGAGKLIGVCSINGNSATVIIYDEKTQPDWEDGCSNGNGGTDEEPTEEPEEPTEEPEEPTEEPEEPTEEPTDPPLKCKQNKCDKLRIKLIGMGKSEKKATKQTCKKQFCKGCDLCL